MDKKYILVTGASSGMGEEIAIKLSSTYNVVLNGRDEERLQKTKEKCSDGNHLIWKFDLEKSSEIEQSLQLFLLNNNIKISFFVHCAGYMKMCPVKMFTSESFISSFNVNVVSAALIVKILSGKKFNDKSLENVVLISSNISNFGAKAFSIYGSSKSALDGLMRSLAIELAPHVRVNSVLPGGVRTRMTEHMYQDETLIERMESTYPLGLGSVSDICSAVCFLLSNESRWITGQQLTVDGGRTINITG